VDQGPIGEPVRTDFSHTQGAACCSYLLRGAEPQLRVKQATRPGHAYSWNQNRNTNISISSKPLTPIATATQSPMASPPHPMDP
jgi:hypothetical protein